METLFILAAGLATHTFLDTITNNAESEQRALKCRSGMTFLSIWLVEIKNQHFTKTRESGGDIQR